MCGKIIALPEDIVFEGLILRVGDRGFKFQLLGKTEGTKRHSVKDKTIALIDSKIAEREGDKHHSIHWFGKKDLLIKTINELNIFYNLPGINNSNLLYRPQAKAA